MNEQTRLQIQLLSPGGGRERPPRPIQALTDSNTSGEEHPTI